MRRLSYLDVETDQNGVERSAYFSSSPLPFALFGTSLVRIRVVPYQPHSLAFGGFEIQMLAAMDAVRDKGIDIKPLDFWSRDANFDMLHLWGLGPTHTATVSWAERAGKPVVMTALLPYLSGLDGVKIRLFARFGSGNAERGMAVSLTTLVVVNEESARTANTLYGLGRDRVAVVPHVVPDQFFEPIPSAHEIDLGIRGFFLCVGNVCPRKNQLAVARAAATVGARVLVLGELLPGEDRYGDELATLIAGRSDMRWIRGTPSDSPEILSAYSQCIGVVLASFNETQPVTALEAIAMRKPLILGARSYARQSFYAGACLVDPADEGSIAEGLRRVLAAPAAYCPPLANIAACRHDRVGESYVEVYSRALANYRGCPQ